MRMIESYIQYAGGYQKDNVTGTDIARAIADVQQMDDEHDAFWVSVITGEENVIEVNKALQVSIIFKGQETKFQAASWNEVEELYHLLLQKRFAEIEIKVK